MSTVRRWEWYSWQFAGVELSLLLLWEPRSQGRPCTRFLSRLCTCSLLPSGGPRWRLPEADRNSAHGVLILVFPREEWGFSGWLSLFIKQIGLPKWQVWALIKLPREPLFVRCNWESLRPQRNCGYLGTHPSDRPGEGPRARPPSGPPAYASYASGQFSGHLSQPEPPWKTILTLCLIFCQTAGDFILST